METLARRSPRFSSLHILDETVPWELYRARLKAARTRPPDGLALVGDELVNDPIVTWKSIILGAIYELSDDDLEFLVLDRLSFRRFAGLTMTEPPAGPGEPHGVVATGTREPGGRRAGESGIASGPSGGVQGRPHAEAPQSAEAE